MLPDELSSRAKLKGEGRSTLVVWSFCYADEVVGTHGPVGLHQPPPVLLGEFGDVVGSLDGSLYVLYALIGPVHQQDVVGYRAFPPFLPSGRYQFGPYPDFSDSFQEKFAEFLF